MEARLCSSLTNTTKSDLRIGRPSNPAEHKEFEMKSMIIANMPCKQPRFPKASPNIALTMPPTKVSRTLAWLTTRAILLLPIYYLTFPLVRSVFESHNPVLKWLDAFSARPCPGAYAFDTVGNDEVLNLGLKMQSWETLHDVRHDAVGEALRSKVWDGKEDQVARMKELASM